MNLPDVESPWLVAVRLSGRGKAVALDSTPLDGVERERAARFLRPEDRASFVAAHTLKRLMLAHATGGAADRMEFVAGAFGKPRLIGWRDMHFNLSHTVGMVAVAWSSKGAVGVDVESLDRAPCEPAVAELVLNPAELESLRGAPDWQRAFLRSWTAKEAVLKALGAGLSTPMADIDVSRTPVLGHGTRWWLSRYFPSPRHLLALAGWHEEMVDGESPRVPCRLLTEAELWAWARSGIPPVGVGIPPTE